MQGRAVENMHLIIGDKQNDLIQKTQKGGRGGAVGMRIYVNEHIDTLVEKQTVTLVSSNNKKNRKLKSMA